MRIDYRFRIMYALGMIFAVASHCGGGGVNLLYDWFPPLVFEMGLFVFISGCLYKSSAEKELRKYIIKKVKSLLVPLYLWNIFYFMVVFCLSFKGFSIGNQSWTGSKWGLPGAGVLYDVLIQPIFNGHQFLYNLGGWFIIPLFMVQIFNVIVRRVISLLGYRIYEWVCFCASLLLGFLGVYLAAKGFNTGWWLALDRMLYFIPFYSLGILYKAKLEKHDNLRSFQYFTIVFLFQLIIIFIVGHLPIYTASWCDDFTDGPILPFLIGFLGIACWLRVSKILEPVIGRSKYIGLIADNTYSIMINQYMGFMLVKTIFAFINKYTIYCSGFNWERYKADIWYCYLPKNLGQTKIIYLAAGIAFPIVVQLSINKLKQTLKKV